MRNSKRVKIVTTLVVFALFPSVGICSEWYVGVWKENWEKSLEKLDMTEKELENKHPILISGKYTRIYITDETIDYSFSAEILQAMPKPRRVTYRHYTIVKNGSSETLIETSNQYGPVNLILKKSDDGICIETILNTDDLGTYIPKIEKIDCYVPEIS